MASTSSSSSEHTALTRPADDPGVADRSNPGKPLVSLVIPAYNEGAIIGHNLAVLEGHMNSLEEEYRWEMIVINDGSTDNTGELAESFAQGRANVRVYHHPTNFGLGQAFKFAFRHCRGDYIVTFDADLSYSPDHIDKLLDRIRATGAKLVLASPYMKGGTISHVPPLRRVLSRVANRFLSLLSYGRLSTLTCMVRAYDGRFLRSVTLRSMGMDIMPETVYKTLVLRGRIEQVPAHLDWQLQLAHKGSRRSSTRIIRHTISTLISGFIFRPFVFFVLPGLGLLLFAIWVNMWMFMHFFEQYRTLPPDLSTDRVSAAVAAAYQLYPHTFIIGLLALMLAIQLISLGILALQSKKYFEEMFYLGTVVRRRQSEE